MAKFWADLIIELAPWVVSVAIPSIGAFLGIRRFNRRQNEQRLSDKQEAALRIERLEKQGADQGVTITNQKAVITRLEQQVGELSHFKILYDTLKEAHDALKIDHDELKAQLTAVKERLAIAEKNAEEKTKENNDQRVFILALENKLSDNERKCEKLQTQLGVYREVITALGLKMAEDEAREGENKLADPSPAEKPAGQSEEKQNGTVE